MRVVLHLVQERQQLRLQAWIITSCGHERVPLVRSTPNEDAVRPSSDIPERSRTAQVYPRRCGWYALGLPAVGRLVRRCGTASPRPSERLATSRCADRSHLPWSRSPRDRPPTTETAKTPKQWTGCSGWADIGRTRLGAPHALEGHSRTLAQPSGPTPERV